MDSPTTDGTSSPPKNKEHGPFSHTFTPPVSQQPRPESKASKPLDQDPMAVDNDDGGGKAPSNQSSPPPNSFDDAVTLVSGILTKDGKEQDGEMIISSIADTTASGEFTITDDEPPDDKFEGRPPEGKSKGGPSKGKPGAEPSLQNF